MTEALRDDRGAPRAEMSAVNPKNRAKWMGCSRIAAAAFRPGKQLRRPQPRRASYNPTESAWHYQGVGNRGRCDAQKLGSCCKARRPKCAWPAQMPAMLFRF